MRNANVKLFLCLAVLIALVAAAGLLFGTQSRYMDHDFGKGPITITATEGLVIPDPTRHTSYNMASDVAFLHINVNGFAYPGVPLFNTGDYTFTYPDGSYNVLHVTQKSMRMDSADCSTQDCVMQGPVSKGSIPFRPLGGQIVCLPHKLVVTLVPGGVPYNPIVLEEEES